MKERDGKILSFKVIDNENEEIEFLDDKREEIITYLEEQIKTLKESTKPPRKAMLIICFNDSDEEDHFQYSAYEITPRDYVYITEKIKLRYLSG